MVEGRIKKVNKLEALKLSEVELTGFSAPYIKATIIQALKENCKIRFIDIGFSESQTFHFDKEQVNLF